MNIVKGGDWIPENRRGWGLDPKKIVVGGGWIPENRRGWGLDPQKSSWVGVGSQRFVVARVPTHKENF